jgi:proteasome lid subunit RPN8/RPN11
VIDLPTPTAEQLEGTAHVRVLLADNALVAIEEALDAAGPHETGGWLCGASSSIVEVATLPGIADEASTTSLSLVEMPGRDRDWLSERGLEVVGLYHSHPGGIAEPSDADLDTFGLVLEHLERSSISAVIIAVDSRGRFEVAAWRIIRADGRSKAFSAEAMRSPFPPSWKRPRAKPVDTQRATGEQTAWTLPSGARLLPEARVEKLLTEYQRSSSTARGERL